MIELEVDLDAIAENYALVRRRADAAEVAPVVKADAYGLGLVEVARRLHAEGARSFFVARIAEGEALREALGAAAAAIHVLDGVRPGEAQRMARSALTPVLNSPDQVATLLADTGDAAGAEVSLHVDTGLNRLGVSLAEAAAIASDRVLRRRLKVGLVISHLACANDAAHPMNRRQHQRFVAAAELFPGARRSLANSAGVWLGRDYSFDLVRPGVALYGGGPQERPEPSLSVAARLSAPVLQVRDVPAGESIGYGAAFTTCRATRVALIGAGYADGVLRASSPGGYGVFDGCRLPFIGRLSMDLIAMDATDTACVKPGDRIELIGVNATLDEVAAAAGTLAYEVLVRIGGRAKRHYVGRRA